jgi:hypothetical protein
MAGLGQGGLLYMEHLQAKVQVPAHANMAPLSPSMSAEWDQLTGEFIHKTCRSFCRHQEATVVKNGAFIELIDNLQPNTHQPVLFKAAISFNKS